MKQLAVFTMCSTDDTPVLGNLLQSLYGMDLDAVIVYATGPSHLTRVPLAFPPSLAAVIEPHLAHLPLVVVDKPLPSPLNISAYLNEVGADLAEQYEWVMRPDTDEVLTDQLVARLNADLPYLTREVVTVAWRWLTLLDDEQHYSAGLSGMLAHGRLYRPKFVNWNNPVHEHQQYAGQRVEYPEYMLHCRQLFAQRCQRQTGFPPAAWSGCVETKRPLAMLGMVATWPTLVWPEEEAWVR